MKQFILFVLLGLFNNFLLAQDWVIEQTRVSDNKTNRIKVGDKVLISFKQLNSEANGRPNSVFVHSLDTGYTRLVLKARITKINENTIEIKDLSVRGNRTILFDKIDGIRKLTTGKQILRAFAQAAGITLYGYGFTYINEDFWSAILYWTGGSTLLAYGSSDFNTKYETQWRLKIIPE